MKSFFQNLSPKWIEVCLVVATTILLALFFRQAFWDLNNFMFAAGGDGLKIHYTMDFYAQYGKDAHFYGFQYPYGTHLMGVENPLLLLAFRWFSQHIFDLTPYSILIINVFMLSFLYVGVLFMYRVLRKVHLPVGFAFFFSLLIIFFSPQTYRWAGHYHLSLMGFFPMIWYAWICIEEGNKTLRWQLFLFFITLIFSFFHLYYFVIGSGFILGNLFMRLLQFPKQWKTQWKKHLLTLICAVTPLLFVQLWIKITTVGFSDVVKHPWGFLYYIASFNSVFLPMEEPQKAFFDFFGFLVPKFLRFMGDVPPHAEGRAYVGFFGLLLLIFCLVRIGKLLFQRKFRRILTPVLPDALQPSLVSSLILLFFAMGYPFAWFDEVEKWAGPFTQFRSCGRFAWAFYYVYMVLLAYFLYAMYRRIRQASQGKLTTFAYALPIFVFSITVLEATVQLKPTLAYIKSGDVKNYYPNWRAADIQGILKQKGLQSTDFQAILAFPYFHIGSEKFGIEGSWFSHFYAYTTARKTGLPLMNNFSARTPLSLTLPSIQLMSYPVIKKKVIQDLKSTKPLLLVYSHEAQSEQAQYLIQKAEKIGELRLNDKEIIYFAKLPLAAFDDTQAQIADNFQHQKANFIAQGQHFCSQTPAVPILTKSYGDAFGFDNQADGKYLWIERGQQTLLDTTLHTSQDSVSLEFSIWLRADIASNYLPAIFIKQFEGEKQVSETVVEGKYSTDIYQNWVRVAAKFPYVKTGNRLFIETNAKKLALDNFMLRPAEVEVYTNIQSDKKFVWNNFPVGQ